MKLNYDCMICQLNKELDLARGIVPEVRRVAFLKEVFQAMGQVDIGCASPAITPLLDQVNARYGFARPDYEPLKKRYNDRMMAILPQLRRRVEACADPLAQAIKLSRAGNYIDFGAFKAIDDGQLDALIQRAWDEALDPAEYAALTADLARAARLTYVTDNCGEVVLDGLVLEQLARRFPQLEMTALTRGGPVLNDATEADARYVGLDRYARVAGNGSDLAGCQMSRISPQARQLLEGSDVIIAKGMANFETLCACGLNVYYLFLCKCDYFARRLSVPLMTGMLVNERRMNLAG